MSYQEEFRKGEESAKIRSRKQGVITALLIGLVIGISIFNDFPIVVKPILFVVLMLILGAVMSSKWMQKKFKSPTSKTEQEYT